MTRAEELASRAAYAWQSDKDGNLTLEMFPDALYRGFLKGYEQAEEDLALTPDDIKLITKIHYEIVFKDTTGIKVGDVASEVLKRFKEARK